MCNALNDSFFNIIICPYISLTARDKLNERLATMEGYGGKRADVFTTDSIPSDTRDMVDFSMVEIDEPRSSTTLS
jgi:hypothetical protein